MGGKRESRNGKKKQRRKNDISEITEEQLDEIRNQLFFGYQRRWYEAKDERILRQSGVRFAGVWQYVFQSHLVTYRS